MPDLDFCKLEVTIVHSLLSFKTAPRKFKNIAAISKYFNQSAPAKHPYLESANTVLVLEFDNTQLDCELKIVDSTEDASDVFAFKVWNFPENTMMYIGDYLLFKYYWESDPTKYTTYHGVIKTIRSKRDTANVKTIVKGQLVNQDILYNWSIYEKYPKLTYYSEVKDFIENELQFSFTYMIPVFSRKLRLTTPILTKGKPVGAILEEVCSQLTAILKDDTCKWKFINGNTILIYRGSDLGKKFLNEQFKLQVPAINYNDLFEYTDNGENFFIEMEGIPTLVSGIVFYVDTTGVPPYITTESAYYVADEIEHTISCTDGYSVKIYCSLTQ